jgi:hypothetical protein
MIRLISDSNVEFICSCGTVTKGEDIDLVIKSYNMENELKSSQLNPDIIQIYAKDRTNERVNIPCTRCKRKYQSRIRDGNNIYITCICNKKI